MNDDMRNEEGRVGEAAPLDRRLGRESDPFG